MTFLYNRAERPAARGPHPCPPDLDGPGPPVQDGTPWTAHDAPLPHLLLVPARGSCVARRGSSLTSWNIPLTTPILPRNRGFSFSSKRPSHDPPGAREPQH